MGAVLARREDSWIAACNEFPRGVEKSSSRLRDDSFKQMAMVHAELNLIADAARHGFSTQGAVLYVTYHPCHVCAGAIIQSGISRVVCPAPNVIGSKWRDSQHMASELMCESNVLVLYPQDEF